MAHFTGEQKARYVQGVFTRIAHRYDLMNRLMTGGQDMAWRKEVIRLARLQPGSSLLDLGAGTGDLAREAQLRHPDVKITAADFTLAMMQAGRKPSDAFGWASADALNLPFPSASFDAVVSGFLMRNVIDSLASLKEQYRVLRPGGRIVILDTTRPQRNLLSPFIWIHMHIIIPTLGTILSGQSDAYNYLPDSTEAFLSAETLAERLENAGFSKIGFQRLMFGTIAIHWAEK